MKRSEMIKILMDVDRYPTPDKSGSITYESRFYNLLDALEEAGMLPPHAVNENPTFNCMCNLRQSCFECGYGNAWQPEDDSLEDADE